MTALSFMFWVVLGGAVVGIIVCARYLIWLRKDHKNQLWKDHKTQIVTITPVVPPFATGGSPPTPPTVRFAASLVEVNKSKPLEETWSNEKIKAWRVINVTVKEGDPDGLWLGFPHPDGPTEDVVTPVRHPIGVELHAECRSRLFPNCHTIPGEQCESTYGSGCGFYAFKTREQAIEYLKTNLELHTCWGSVVAHVLLSGKVIEHEDGYRAEILEVVSMEPVLYRDSHESFSTVVETTTRAFQAFSKAYIASGGV